MEKFSSELTNFTSFSGDIDEAASTLRKLIDSLPETEDGESGIAVEILAAWPSPFTELYSDESNESMPHDLSEIYDKFVDLWISCLPRKTPGPVRLAIERVVRSIATELYLSSMALLIRDKSVILPETSGSKEGVDFTLPVRAKPCSLGQVASQESLALSSPPGPRLPTPATTPSARLPEKPLKSSGLSEDGAISRLRAYGLVIKSQPPLGAARSAILSHWPCTPGADPSKYSWEAARNAVPQDQNQDAESDDDEAFIRKRKEEQRRRREEKFLKRQRKNTLDAASQPGPTVLFGSQPGPALHVASSQAGDVPMTQPDRGLFGSRLGQMGFKKRRKMGF